MKPQNCGCNTGIPTAEVSTTGEAECNCNSIIGLTGDYTPWIKNDCDDCLAQTDPKQHVMSCADQAEWMNLDPTLAETWVTVQENNFYCSCEYHKCDFCGICGGNNQCQETCTGTFNCADLEVGDYRCNGPACAGSA